MKALILAAGFGTRLLPYTKLVPKPLFPVGKFTALERTIMHLMGSGCSEIVINTHHLHRQVEAFISEKNFPIQVHTRFEPKILGTGGAIKNTSDVLGNSPFIVINSDIITDINIKDVYDFHMNHTHPATLVLHDYEIFNKVVVMEDNFITGFHGHSSPPDMNSSLLAFTGIQVLDPELTERIEGNTHSSSIDLYSKMISEDIKIKAYISKNHLWTDIGTPESYKEAVYRFTIQDALTTAFPEYSEDKITTLHLAGDGSDRQWYRVASQNFSMIMADHGIRKQPPVTEVDSFIAINRHLEANGVNVPKIYHAEPFSGLVFLEDLGDVHLQSHVYQKKEDNIFDIYKHIIDDLVHMSVSCAKHFSPECTYQTADYNQNLILEKECRYFVEAFLQGYLNLDISYDSLKNDFIVLSNKALSNSFVGFMHRDFQSRNIMYHNEKFYFIDFQGGRLGPIQYDLASLIIDPYVSLPLVIQSLLLDYATNSLSSIKHIDPERFYNGYMYCSLTRNLQILGAFGFLSKVKEKTFFEQYIPTAIQSLQHCLGQTSSRELPDLKSVVNGL